MILELDFRLYVMAAKEHEQWILRQQTTVKHWRAYQWFVLIKDVFAWLIFHPARAKVQLVVALEEKIDFVQVRKALDTMLSNTPQNLSPLLDKLKNTQLLFLKYRCDGLSNEETALKMNITSEAVRKQGYRLGLETGISVKEWIKLCSRKGGLFS